MYAGFLGTESSTDDFKVRIGDYIETKVLLPDRIGAWPGLWTWLKVGYNKTNNEVDPFEYHGDNNKHLEFTTRVPYTEICDKKFNDYVPGEWIVIGTYFGTEAVEW